VTVNRVQKVLLDRHEVMWVPVTTKWRVLGLSIKEAASRYEEQLRLYSIVNHEQPTRGSPPAWGLGEGLITPYRKKKTCYEMLHRSSELNGLFGTTSLTENGYEI
jgi:hypothetical protein